MTPFFPLEAKLRKQGFQFIAGIDEAGRGPLAGPVVSAAVILKENCRLPGLKDSKLLTHKQRHRLFHQILKNAQDYAITAVSHVLVDEFNILRATIFAHDLCLSGLNIKPDLALIDGRDKQIIDIPFYNIIKGDRRIRSIAAASVLAKVMRDKIMTKYSEEFPNYGFSIHMGYGTRKHRINILKFGRCEIHRKSFTFKIPNPIQ